LKPMPLFPIVAIAMLLWVAGTSAGETLYRWVDDSGNQVNSDRPPAAGVKYEVISTRSSMVRSVNSQNVSTAAENTSQDTTPDSQPLSPGRSATEKNPQFCAQARDNLTQLDTRARIRMRNADGEIRYLNEKERAAERDKALMSIEAHCE
jgi:hypothetical protein